MNTIILCCILTAATIVPVLAQPDHNQDLELTADPAEYQALQQRFVSMFPDDTDSGSSEQYLSSGRHTASSGDRDSAPPVIVQLTPAVPETLSMMSEDLAVMTRVIARGLESKLGKEDKPTKLSVQMLLTGSGRSVRAMHIEGLGPLFMIKVNFPLVPPPKTEKASAPTTGSEWEQARREIIGITAPRDRVWMSRIDSGVEFRGEPVEALKAALLSALKQAHNIRYLKADDFITLCVFGTGGSTVNVSVRQAVSAYWDASTRGAIRTVGDQQPRSVPPAKGSPTAPRAAATTSAAPGAQSAANAPFTNARSTSQYSEFPKPETPASAGGAFGTVEGSTIAEDPRTGRIMVEGPLIVPVNHALGQSTVLTIRVKKGDVDAFAKDEVDLKTFEGRATINAYAGAGYDVTSVNTWLGR